MPAIVKVPSGAAAGLQAGNAAAVFQRKLQEGAERSNDHGSKRSPTGRASPAGSETAPRGKREAMSDKEAGGIDSEAMQDVLGAMDAAGAEKTLSDAHRYLKSGENKIVMEGNRLVVSGQAIKNPNHGIGWNFNDYKSGRQFQVFFDSNGKFMRFFRDFRANSWQYVSGRWPSNLESIERFDQGAYSPSLHRTGWSRSNFGNKQNGWLEPQYGSWRHYFQDHDYSNYQLRSDVNHYGANYKFMKIRDNQDSWGSAIRFNVLADAFPIRHDGYGIGWEVHPVFEKSGNSVQDKRDAAPHRVYFRDDNAEMSVFSQNDRGGWDYVGNRVPDFKASTHNKGEVAPSERAVLLSVPSHQTVEARQIGSGASSWRDFVNQSGWHWLSTPTDAAVHLMSGRNVLAVANTISDPALGRGVEVHPVHIDASAQDRGDHEPIRAFIGQDGVKILKRQDIFGNWVDVGSRLPAFARKPEHVLQLEEGGFPRAARVLAGAFEDFNDTPRGAKALQAVYNTSGDQKVHIEVKDFAGTIEDGLDLTKYKDTSYVYDAAQDRLYFNVPIVTSARPWQGQLLSDALNAVSDARVGKAVEGDPVADDRLVGRTVTPKYAAAKPNADDELFSEDISTMENIKFAITSAFHQTTYRNPSLSKKWLEQGMKLSFQSIDDRKNSFEIEKNSYTNYIYDPKDRKLIVNANAMTIDAEAVAAALWSHTGQEWNQIIVERAMQFSLNVDPKTADENGNRSKLPVVPGPPRWTDYANALGLRTKRETSVPMDNYLGGYGHTSAWGNRFRYGAFSTQLANAVLAENRFKQLVPLLQGYSSRTTAEKEQIKSLIKEYKLRYNTLSPPSISKIINDGLQNRTPSIFEEEHSAAFQTGEQNIAFIKGVMEANPGGAPIDNRYEQSLDKRQLNAETGYFEDPPFEYQTHRTSYNNAYGVPQNTTAGILSGYMAGVRSFELDVLETGGQDGDPGTVDLAKGADNEVVVVHDLITNRTNADYGASALHPIETATSDDFFATMRHGILDPTAPAPKLDGLPIGRKSDVKGQRLTDVLDFLNDYANDAALVLDARNDSPVGVAKIMADRRADPSKPIYDDNATSKIYNYTLPDGYDSIRKKYIARYTDANLDPAERSRLADEALRKFRTVVVVGGVGESPGLDAVSNLTPEAMAQVAPDFVAQYRFPPEAKQEVAKQAYPSVQFANSFLGNTDVSGVQLPGTLSDRTKALAAPLQEGDAAYLAAGETIENAIKSLRDFPTAGFHLHKNGAPRTDVDISTAWNQTRLGVSDRFPDLVVGKSGQPAGHTPDTQKAMNNYNAHGGNLVPANDLFSRLRSTVGQPTFADPIMKYEAPISFATTDAHEDLMGAKAGVLGTGPVRETVRHNPRNRLKPSVANSPSTFSPAEWTTEFLARDTFSDMLRYPTFKPDEIAPFRRRVENVVRDDAGYTSSDSWLNRWSSGESFAREVATNYASKNLLKFDGNGGFIVPFSGMDIVTDKDKAKALCCGYFSFSPDKGLGIYGADKEFNLWYAHVPRVKDHWLNVNPSGDYRFSPWTPGTDRVPVDADPWTQEQELIMRRDIKLGTQNLSDSDLIKAFTGGTREGAAPDDAVAACLPDAKRPLSPAAGGGTAKQPKIETYDLPDLGPDPFGDIDLEDVIPQIGAPAPVPAKEDGNEKHDEQGQMPVLKRPPEWANAAGPTTAFIILALDTLKTLFARGKAAPQPWRNEL